VNLPDWLQNLWAKVVEFWNSGEKYPVFFWFAVVVNFLTVLWWFKERRQKRGEQALKEQQIKLNHEISEKLSRYQELFGELDINKQLKQLLVERQARINEADKALSQLNLTLEERNQLLAERKDAIERLDEEQKKILAEKQDDLKRLEERLKQVVATAQNEALRETIKKRLQILEREINEVEALKAEYDLTDETLDLPTEVKANLKQSLHKFVPLKQELSSQAHLLQIALLAIFVFLLPYPLDRLVLLISAIPLFLFVIDLIRQLNHHRLQWLTLKSYRVVIFLTLYVLWFSIISWIKGLLSPFTSEALAYAEQTLKHYNLTSILPAGGSDDPAIAIPPSTSTPPAVNTWMRTIQLAVDIAPYILSLITASLDYFRVVKPVRAKIASLQETFKARTQQSPDDDGANF